MEEEKDYETEYEATDEDIAFDDDAGVKDKLKKLREDLKACQKEKTEYLTGWQRAQADYANLKREAAEETKKSAERVKGGFVGDLLPTLDSFAMAFGNKEAWEKVDPNWRSGVEYIHTQLMAALENNGVSVIEAVDAPFDPAIHEPMETVATDDPSLDGMVKSVVQRGYRIGERVIRPARVIVWSYKEE